VKRTHVNLIDLVDTKRTGKPVEVFQTEALREYTKKTRKFMPREDALAGGILRFLRRKILD
ncbi:hypothetical protein BDQ17DRAFT_1176355, partial [Cyathus striatus]